MEYPAEHSSTVNHVESHWRTQLRNRIIQASSLLEILLSGLVLIGLLFSAVPLIKWMPGLCSTATRWRSAFFWSGALTS